MRVLMLALTTALSFGGHSASAGLLDRSLRPEARPSGETSQTLQLASVMTPLETSLRPTSRPVLEHKKRNVTPEAILAATSHAGFKRWISGFRSRALKSGISGSTFDRAFRGVQYNSKVIERDRNQTEFTKTIWQYLEIAASDERIKKGKAALRKHNRKLEAISKRYGVEKEVITAVWGLESRYGERRGDIPTIEALATLAYDGRRGRFFEKQLIGALKILQSGDTTPARMVGSWAGAMGHTQFIPTSYLAYAVDATGDGRRDIWSNDPSDALASTAAYLKRFGWTKGQPWGVEVRLPRNFNYGLASKKIKKNPSEWGRLGVTDMRGRAVPNYGSASILLPAGSKGAAFMIFNNFNVIKRYNASDSYVIGVGHLSDRIKGAGPIQASWPKDPNALSLKQRKQLQRRLTRKGFDTGGVDGNIGPKSIAAIKAYQRSVGLTPDGYPSHSLFKRLR